MPYNFPMQMDAVPHNLLYRFYPFINVASDFCNVLRFTLFNRDVLTGPTLEKSRSLILFILFCCIPFEVSLRLFRSYNIASYNVSSYNKHILEARSRGKTR